MNHLRLFSLWCLMVALVGCADCGKPMCAAGAKDCACLAGDTCNDGLTCTASKCVAAVTVGVQVSDPAARGCELVLTEASASSVVADVTFKNGVVGQFVREAPRTSIAFVAPTDGALPSGGIEVALSGDPAGVTVSKSSCVGSGGQKLSNVTISIR